MERPRVSVVMPTHNRAGLLERAIHSVLAQTYSDLELIVVDDGSTDGTAELLSEVNDPRLVSIRQPRQQGAAVARNTGIRRAGGELVAFQDSDDEWLPTKLELQLSVFANHGPDLGAVGGRYLMGDGTDTTQVLAPNLERGADYEAELLDGRCLITPVWVIRRSVLEGLGLFDERMPCLEDWDLMLRLSERTGMRAVPETVLIKHAPPASLGADIDRRAPAMEEILARHGRRFLAYPKRHASFCLELAYLCLLRGQLGRTVRYAARAMRRRGASAAMLRAFLGASVRARLLRRPVSFVPGPVGD